MGTVIYIDPFFHYHAPTEGFVYEISSQRYQNHGIAQHFCYSGMIVGTSITQNFRPSVLDESLGTESVKLPAPGATYKEVADLIDAAYDSGNDLKYVLRSLDFTSILREKDEMRTDLGDYPFYLYDKNPFNDVPYLLSQDVLINWCLPVIKTHKLGYSGWTDFDTYDRFSDPLGAKYVLSDRDSFLTEIEQPSLSESERQIVRDNIEQNVVRQVREHPETTYYLFFPGYSIAFWGMVSEKGLVNKYLEAERIALDMLLCYDNAHVFCMNSEKEIITDLNNYSDYYHYSSEINDYILESVLCDRDRVYVDTYEQYLEEERAFITEYDFNSLFTQIDAE